MYAFHVVGLTPARDARFSLKFQRIVEIEQESNFITRLHGGKLAIIPWPVIESRQFYGLFPRLKQMLDGQPIIHATAGAFLQTVKTLMAKLKVKHDLITRLVGLITSIRPTIGDHSTVQCMHPSA